jgi:hypothetical protein
MFKTILLIITYFVSYIVADICTDFRITSPITRNLKWTAGQCYQVSYDVSSLGTIIDRAKLSVDVYQAKTNKKVSRVIQEEFVDFETGATRPFSLDIGHNNTRTASYYYIVTLYYGERKCQPQKTVEFRVQVDPQSPPAQCYK